MKIQILKTKKKNEDWDFCFQNWEKMDFSRPPTGRILLRNEASHKGKLSVIVFIPGMMTEC